jgi:hypothetical protein
MFIGPGRCMLVQTSLCGSVDYASKRLFLLRFNDIWKIVLRSQSNIVLVEQIWAVHFAHSCFTRKTYVTCIFCHTLTWVCHVHFVMMGLCGLTGSLCANTISRNMQKS